MLPFPQYIATVSTCLLQNNRFQLRELEAYTQFMRGSLGIHRTNRGDKDRDPKRNISL